MHSIESAEPATNADDEAGNYAPVRYNAMRHGILSMEVVLPNEDIDQFNFLLAALIDEHDPQGTTESLLVEEMACIIWRKRRVIMSERAAYHAQLRSTRGHKYSARNDAVPAYRSDSDSGLGGYYSTSHLLGFTDSEAAAELDMLRAEEGNLREACKILDEGDGSYEDSLAVLNEENKDAWLKSRADATDETSAATLRSWLDLILRQCTLPAIHAINQRRLLRERTAWAAACIPYRADGLSRYEVHLDRKFQRTLAMLLKLKELRGSGTGASDVRQIMRSFLPRHEICFAKVRSYSLCIISF